MTYQAPIADIRHAMTHIAGGWDADGPAEAVLTEAGRFATDVLLPLDGPGDRAGVHLGPDGAVRTAPGWKDAYRRWIEAGWNGLAAPTSAGGQALGHVLQAGTAEIWSAANLSFGLCPLLTTSAIEAVRAHGSAELQRLYLPKLVSGTWTGTMNLTEPQAGSDLSDLRTRAEPRPDGSYAITGQKIYISYGEHDLAENIIHLVLARLPDAAPGTRGISLFLVPKRLVGSDGALGARNDLRCAGLERKLGLHAAPTCTMRFGDAGGATGFLVGEAGRGLNAMFTMMNQARLAVGLQGVGAAERATQQAVAFAAERRQGRASGDGRDAGPSLIIRHPDVARLCMTMTALTAAARAICYLTAAAFDGPEGSAAAAARGALLTPVAKAFATDVAVDVASLNIQVHGGMGYIEDAGAAQILRDARILPIYEGTNGIQAIDLVSRKIGLEDGRAMEAEIAAMRSAVAGLAAQGGPRFALSAQRLDACVDALRRATDFLRERLDTRPAEALAGATPYLRLFALARGGTALTSAALAAEARQEPGWGRHGAVARFFAEHIAVEGPGIALSIIEGGHAVDQWRSALTGDG